MKREVIYLKVKVVLEYETQADRKDGIAKAKENVTAVDDLWGKCSVRPVSATLIKEPKK